MTGTGRLTWPVQRRGDFLRIISYIIIATTFIFIFDSLTPLGIVNWILYLIPLFLTVYLSWKYAPFVMTAVFICLMAVSLILSPRDVSIEYAMLNRAFFALILVIASFFIKDYISNVEVLTLNEERYRNLVEWLPEGILVYRKGDIEYVNPAAIRILGADSSEEIIGRDIIDMIDPEGLTIFRERVNQALLGARMDIDNVLLIRQTGNLVSVGMSLASVFWDRERAVQIVMRNL